MAYWLFKSEPGNWSWNDQVKRGAKGDEWDGVRNHTAKLNIQAMRPGDFGFFYHSVDEKRIVGITRIISEPHRDPTDETGTWFSVRIAADTPLPHPITLAEIRREPRLAEMALVKQSRLSVQPVTDNEWEIICTMAAVKKAPKSAAKAPAKSAAKAPAKSAAKAPAKTVAAKKPAASKTAKAAPKTAAKPAAKPAAKKTAAKKPAAKGSKK
jgi:predicted RNA-binding protein with PUA-like domain